MMLREMRRLLAERGIRLTRSLGQNFLYDANQLRRIVDAAELNATDRVLEIGPGLGPLTELLLTRASQVLAIETDARLVSILQERFAALGHLTLIHDDALAYLRREARDWSGWKLVANLPYSVASPILVELALQPRPPRQLVATLQWEVAQRLVASASDPAYGILTLLVQLAYEPAGAFKIPSSCFFPEPDVDSACVTLRRRAVPLLDAAATDDFVRLVRRAFSQRRKQMFKLLRADWPVGRLGRAYAALALPANARAEAVTLEQFVALTAQLRSGMESPP
jgi:16S rRNA (adenine1518-N6/adenine1519-N6)-dimethyltransferase